MFKALVLAAVSETEPFVASTSQPRSFAADARFCAAEIDPVRVRDELALLSPVGAVIEEELRLSEAPGNLPPVDAATLRAEGFEAGRAAALQELSAELAAARRLTGETLCAVAQQIAIDPGYLAPRIEKLVFAIARAVIGDDLKIAPESLRARIDSALADLADNWSAEISVNPADLPLFADLDAAARQRLTIAPSEVVGRGEFRMRSGDAELVDRIADRIVRVERGVIG